MKELALVSGALLGAMAVIFGAFGAHALKKKFSDELLKSFETGVKYQMYHSLLLILLGSLLIFQTSLEKWILACLLLGTLLFSFSIYGLCISTVIGKKLRFLGPVTPLGGLLLVAGWLGLIYYFLVQYSY